MANRLGIYLDESATDGGTPIAVVGGLLLDWNRYAWLDVEWGKALFSFGVKALHMRDVQNCLRGVSKEDQRKLFEKLVWVINDNKGWSIGATLSHEEHRTHFAWLGDQGWGVYATCFLLAAVQIGKQLEYEKYPYTVPYLLDDGNAYKDQVIEAHGHIVNIFQQDLPYHCGTLDFGDDEKVRSLQAADVISWAIRRKWAGKPFRYEHEPLEGIFAVDHVEQRFRSEWMADISEALRKKQELREAVARAAIVG